VDVIQVVIVEALVEVTVVAAALAELVNLNKFLYIIVIEEI